MEADPYHEEMPMEFLPLRTVALPRATEREYASWVESVDERLRDDRVDRSELVRQLLTAVYYPQYVDADPRDLPEPTRIALLQMDPRNVTLEPEYYREVDVQRYAKVKPLQWLWEMFDKSPLGENVHLGVRLRRVLARHMFGRVGRNFKAFHFVKFSFGYNLDVGDDVVVHRHVLLDDRGGIRIGDGASIADFANVYSHTHALYDGRYVDCPRTIIGDGVRLTYHATVLAGVHLKEDAMLGSLAVATRDVESGDVALGIPAVPKLKKPPPDRRPRPGPTVDPLADEAGAP
jgi:acetyltransferase-like isoleucine patch superfamily enzyme